MTPKEQLAIAHIVCSYCGAQRGKPCFNVTGGAKRPYRNYPHEQRVRALGATYFNEKHVVNFTSQETKRVRTRSLVDDIATGFGNDDQLMERALDMEESGEPYATPYPPGDARNLASIRTQLWNETEGDPAKLVGMRIKAVVENVEPSPYGLFQINAPQDGEKAVSKKAALERQLDRVLTELDKLEAMGEDVYEDDTVLSIKVKHPNYEKEYDYIALKSDGRWYITGYQNQGPRSWDKMMEFFSHSEIIGIWVATGWEQVV